MNGISFVTSEVFKYVNLDDILSRISIVPEDGILLGSSVIASVGSSGLFKDINTDGTLVGKSLVEEDRTYHVVLF